MYTILDKKETDHQRHVEDIEPLYGPPILKKNRRFKDAVSWGCILLVLLVVVTGLIVVCVLLFNHVQSSDIRTAENHSPVAGKGTHSESTSDSNIHIDTITEIPPKAKKSDDSDTVRINCGSIKGTLENGIHTYKGIPYAVPPVGEYRWRPPVAREIQPEVCNPDMQIDATDFGDKCMQWDPTGHNIIGDEDCLFLNVWTPSPDDSAGLEIMVFIHGGGTQTEFGHLYGAGLLSGSGNEPGFMPTPELVKAANMVFVTFNYRLGAFGFLAVDVKNPNTKQTIKGNFGLMDQHLALEWVKTNARAFGGDPEKITVFGVGAGASSILIHLASSQKPVFQQAWAASPSPHYNTTLKTAFRQNQEFLQSSRCGGLGTESAVHSCLYDLSTEEVFQAYPYTKWENRMFRGLPTQGEGDLIRGLIIVDETFLKKIPYDLWSSYGDHHNIPLMIGNAAQEIDDWPIPPNIDSWSWVDYESYLFERLAAFQQSDLAAQVQNLYPKIGSPELQFTTIVSDMRENCPVSAVAQLLSFYWKEPVYRYIANYSAELSSLSSASSRASRSNPTESSSSATTTTNTQTDSVMTTSNGVVQSAHRYAYHSIDMYHFFNKLQSGAANSADNDNTQARQFTQKLRNIIFEFARTGRVRNWAYYPDATYIVSSQINRVRQYHETECTLWRNHGMFPHYAWMN